MQSKRSLIFSVLLHAILVFVLVVSIDFGPDEVAKTPIVSKVVKAKVVDGAAVAQEVERLQAAETQARRLEEEKLREVERKTAAAEAKRKSEEARVRELEAEQRRLQEERKVADARKAEEQRQVEEHKKAEELARKADEQRKVAEQKQAEEQRKAAEELKRKEAQRAEEARKEAERKRVEQQLQADLAAEEAAAQAVADQNEIDTYMVAIYKRVVQSFTILPGFEGLTCTLRIHFIPGGEVTRVEIVKSSGNPIFDRQAENAVRKAAPLPVPSDPRLFQRMRSIAFVFEPT